jgi:hypothetical protein
LAQVKICKAKKVAVDYFKVLYQQHSSFIIWSLHLIVNKFTSVGHTSRMWQETKSRVSVEKFKGKWQLGKHSVSGRKVSEINFVAS